MESKKRSFDSAFNNVNSPPPPPTSYRDDDEVVHHAIPLSCCSSFSSYSNNNPDVHPLMERDFINLLEHRHHHQPQQQQQQQQEADNDDEYDEDSKLLLLLLAHLQSTLGYTHITHLQFVGSKTITKNDSKDSQACLAILKGDINRDLFLTKSEDLFLSFKHYEKQKDGTLKQNGNMKFPIHVIVGSSQYHMSLTRWNFGQANNNNNDDNNNNNNNNNNNKSRKSSKKAPMNQEDNNDNNNNSNEVERPKKKRKVTKKSCKQGEGDDQQQIGKKKTGGKGWKYVVNQGWNQVRREHDLKEGDVIRLVSFRCNNYIHLAILKQPPPTFRLFGAHIPLR